MWFPSRQKYQQRQSFDSRIPQKLLKKIHEKANSIRISRFADLAIFCSYGYGANASEAVEKIATDENDYRKWSLCGLTRVEQLVTRTPLSYQKKTADDIYTEKGAISGQWCVFFHSGSELRIYRASNGNTLDGIVGYMTG